MNFWKNGFRKNDLPRFLPHLRKYLVMGQKEINRFRKVSDGIGEVVGVRVGGAVKPIIWTANLNSNISMKICIKFNKKN